MGRPRARVFEWGVETNLPSPFGRTCKARTGLYSSGTCAAQPLPARRRRAFGHAFLGSDAACTREHRAITRHSCETFARSVHCAPRATETTPTLVDPGWDVCRDYVAMCNAACARLRARVCLCTGQLFALPWLLSCLYVALLRCSVFAWLLWCSFPSLYIDGSILYLKSRTFCSLSSVSTYEM